MNHEVHIIDYKKLSEQFAVCTRCCGDEQHTSWHTMLPSVMIDDAALEASISKHCEHVAQQHEAALQAEVHLKNLVGTSRQADPAAATVQ